MRHYAATQPRKSSYVCFLVLVHCLCGNTFATAGDEKPMVGRWDLVSCDGILVDKEIAGTKYVRFSNDGTFKANILLFTTDDGKYKVLSDKAIEVDVPGVIYGRNKFEVTYRLLNRNTLQLDLASGKAMFKRLDSGR